MGDLGDREPKGSQVLPDAHETKQQTHHQENVPFHAQLEHFSASHQQGGPNYVQYGQQHAYDMSSMAGALPSGSPVNQSSPYGPGDATQMMHSPNPYQTSQQMAFQTQRGNTHPGQQQPYFPPQYGPGPNPISPMQRQQPFPMQTQIPFSPMDGYGYGMSPASFSPVDPRFGGSPHFAMPGGLPPDMAQFARRSSNDSAPIPSYPRGPPRKPKQSGHALWVGNLPPAASITDLKDHFSRDATNDIESVFLIAKSNCAFVNYRTEAACTAAMNRFHDSRFHGVRLVCRLRRGNGSSTTTPTSATVPEEADESATTPTSAPVVDGVEDSSSPTIARSSSVQETSASDARSSTQPASDARVPEKYFIVKSLTAQDLEASVRNKTWATQSHNEDALNKAYTTADNVYLIFSANKSGEYFGYARMTSLIAGEPVSLLPTSSSSGTEEPDSAGSPQSIPTPATQHAPRGRIIDDSARGTIFWEADPPPSSSLAASGGPDADGVEESMLSGQSWGKQFSIEWVSTARLPFYRTRGLRNPWNANREVKIARDGTELEPTIGRRLVGLFQQQQGQQGQPQRVGGGGGLQVGPSSAQGYSR